jgi:hypothetical protein
MLFFNSETGKMYSADDLYIDLLLNATASGLPDDPACVWRKRCCDDANHHAIAHKLNLSELFLFRNHFCNIHNICLFAFQFFMSAFCGVVTL